MFIKNGDAEKIISVIKPEKEEDLEKIKKAFEEYDEEVSKNLKKRINNEELKKN